MKWFAFLGLGLALVLGLVFGLVLLLQSPPEDFEPVTVGEMHFEVPENSSVEPVQDGPWHGARIHGFGTLSMWQKQADGADVNAEIQDRAAQLGTLKARIPVSLFDGGLFLCQAQGRSWRLYVYLFQVDNQIVWAQMESRHSTLSTYKHVLDHAVASLHFAGRVASPEVREELSRLDDHIRMASQSPVFFAWLGIILYLVLMTTFGVLTWLSGRIPKNVSGEIVLAQGYVFISAHMKRRKKGVFGAVVLTDEQLLVTAFGKTLGRLGRGQGKQIQMERAGSRTRLVLQTDVAKLVLRVHHAEQWAGRICKVLGG